MNYMPQFHELFLFLVMMMTGVIMGIIRRMDNNNNIPVSVRVRVIWVVVSVWGIFFAQHAFCIDLFIFMNMVTIGWLTCPLLGYNV